MLSPHQCMFNWSVLAHWVCSQKHCASFRPSRVSSPGVSPAARPPPRPSRRVGTWLSGGSWFLRSMSCIILWRSKGRCPCHPELPDQIKSEESTMKLVGGFYFWGPASPGTLGFLVVVPALLFIKDHEKQDKLPPVHGLPAFLVQSSSPADQERAYQARVDVPFLKDSGRNGAHTLSAFSLLFQRSIVDHMGEGTFLEAWLCRV